MVVVKLIERENKETEREREKGGGGRDTKRFKERQIVRGESRWRSGEVTKT